MVYRMLKIIRNTIRNKQAQGTIEFAIVTSVILIIVVVLGYIWNLGDQGIFAEHALSSASHHLKDSIAGIVGDVFSY